MLQDAKDLGKVSKNYVALLDDFCLQYALGGLVMADHICIKCESHESFVHQRELFSFGGRFIYQSIISNRSIAVIGLQEAIKTSVGEIRYLELSDQKKDGSQKERVDHIEIVPTSISYDELVSHLQKQGVQLQEIVRPHHTTHDIVLPEGFIIRLSRELLINKIKGEEMV